jgi:O-antigen ligase
MNPRPKSTQNTNPLTGLDLKNLLWFLPIAILLFYPPFFRGLFFSKEILLTHALTSIIFLIFVLRKWRNKQTLLITSSMDMVVLILVCAYLLSIIGAVNLREALGGFFKVFNYFMIFWLVREIAVNYRTYKSLLIVLFASSVGVAIIGIGAALGIIDYPGAFNGSSIMSTLQYTNTTCIYVAIMSIIGVALAVTEKRLPVKLLYVVSTILLLVVMLSAVSKGAWVALLAALILFLVVIPGGSRLQSVGFFLFSLILAWISSSKLLPILISKDPLPATKETVISELSGLTDIGTNSFVARWDFYIDAIKMMGDYPLFGAGAGGWNSLYHQYQNHLYWTTEVHNHFLQVVVEAGLLGLLAWLAIFLLLGYYLWHILKRRNDSLDQDYEVLIWGTACAAFGLVLHSAIDFDLSIPSMQILLFTFIGLISGAYHADFIGPQERESHKMFRMRPSFNRLLTGLVIAFAVLLLSAGSCFALGAFHADKAEKTAQAGQYSQALNHYEKATRLDPLNGKYYTDFARFCAVMWSKVEPGNVNSPLYKQAINEAHLAESLAWNDYKTMVSLDDTYHLLAGEEEMIRVGKRVIELNPWVVSAYDRLLGTYFWSINQWLMKDPSRASDRAASAMSLAKQLSQQISKVNDQRGWSGPKLEFTDSIKAKQAQVYFYQGDYDQAADLFGSVKDETLVKNEQFQAFYAAALYKAGQQEAARTILEQDHTEQADFTALYQYLISLSPLEGR